MGTPNGSRCEEVTQLQSPPRSAESANSCVILSSSRNAVSISSDRMTNLLRLSRWASTIQIVCPLESIAETQPQLHPALLRLSAKIFSVLHWITTSQDTGKWSENCEGFCSMRVSSRDALSKIDSGCLAAADFLFVFRDTHCERVDVPPKLRLAIPRHLQLAFAA